MEPTTGREPIFILSCYRTGSTLLRYIFDTHPDVYAPPEIGLGDTAFHLAHLECGLIGLQFDRAEQIPAEIIARTRAILAGRLDAATASRGKLRWCEKTPTNLTVLNLGLLRVLFPEARLVCLHRHVFDVAKSLIKMIYRAPDLQSFLAHHKGNEVAAALDYWNQRTTTLIALEAELPERCVHLRYEDMVARPAEVLPPIFATLGLAWDDRLLKSVFTAQHDHGMEDHYVVFSQSIHSASVGSGRDLPLDGVPAPILETAHRLLKTLGYPEMPAPLQREEPAAAPPPVAAPRSAAWLFDTHLPERMRAEPQLLKAVGSSYRISVLGEGGGIWVVDPRQGKVSSGPIHAACSIEISTADLFAIAHGQLHPWKAAEQKRLRFQGHVIMHELDALMRLLRLAA